jgi:fructokinase
MTAPKEAFDFIALGESLIDFISCKEVASLAEAECYQRFVGGESSNLARNMALLGNQVALGICVGDDHLGEYIRARLSSTGVSPKFIQTTLEAPTTLVLVTKTPGGTPDFMIYRGADAYLRPTDSLLEAAGSCRLIHTSAFALSRNPARGTILQALDIAHKNKALISFDPNYHPAIWPDIANFTSLLERAYQYIDITKPSLDDCMRIFSPGLDPLEYTQRFIQWGAKIVILTMGADGVLLTTAEGETDHILANQIAVADVTGAGDAYWAGFLTAILENKTPLEAGLYGQALAEIKIETVGPLPQSLDLGVLANRVQAIRHQKYVRKKM